MLAHALLRVGLAAAVLAPLALPAAAQTLKTVKERGMLNCGISEGVLGFSTLTARAGLPASTPISVAPSLLLSWAMRAR